MSMLCSIPPVTRLPAHAPISLCRLSSEREPTHRLHKGYIGHQRLLHADAANSWHPRHTKKSVSIRFPLLHPAPPSATLHIFGRCRPPRVPIPICPHQIRIRCSLHTFANAPSPTHRPANTRAMTASARRPAAPGTASIGCKTSSTSTAGRHSVHGVQVALQALRRLMKPFEPGAVFAQGHGVRPQGPC